MKTVRKVLETLSIAIAHNAVGYTTHYHDYDINKALHDLRELLPKGKESASEWNSGFNSCLSEVKRLFE